MAAMRKTTTILLILAATLPAAAAVGVPTSVTNYFMAALPGTTVAAEPVLAGTVIEDRLIPYATPPSWSAASSGTVQVRTVRGADGRLSFYWRITADRGSKDVVTGLDIHGFPRAVYDANWRRDGLGSVAPVLLAGLDRGDGWELRFGFPSPNGIHAGEESRFFFLRTSARTSVPARIRVRFGNTWSAYLPAAGPAS